MNQLLDLFKYLMIVFLTLFYTLYYTQRLWYEYIVVQIFLGLIFFKPVSFLFSFVLDYDNDKKDKEK